MVMIKLNFAKFKPNFSEKDKFASIYIWIFYLFIAHFSHWRAKRICAKTGASKEKISLSSALFALLATLS